MNNWLKILFGFWGCWYSQSIPLPNTTEAPKQMPIDILLTGLAATPCCEPCGRKYCPSLDTCVKPLETYCQEWDFPYNALYEGSGIIIPPKDKDALSSKKN